MTDRPAPSPPDKIRFRCPKCARRFVAAAADVGRSSKCPGCGEAVVVPAESEPGFGQTDFSDVFTFACRLCGTRLSARPRHVGRKMKCPDCEATTRVPEPAPKAAPQTPAAIEGRQYEVYEGDNQPWGTELARKQAKYLTVLCRRCQTPMSVGPSAIGKRVVCADCGTKTVVQPPVEASPAKTFASPGPDYELDESAPPPEAPHHAMYDEVGKRPPAGYRDLVDAEPERAGGRPTPPPLAVLRGWTAFWLNPAMVTAWVAFSVAMMFVLAFFGLILMALSVGLFTAVILLSGPIICALAWTGVFAFLFYEIIVESSEGNDRVVNWPTINLYDWMGPLLNLVIVLIAACAPGYLVEQWFGAETLPGVASLVTTLVLPFVVLSQLEVGFPLGVFSPRVALSYFYAPLSWVTFYAIALGVERANVLLYDYVEANVFGWSRVGVLVVMVAADVFFMLSYARLVGRLAWVIGETVPAQEER